jgi:hypothetical protein
MATKSEVIGTAFERIVRTARLSDHDEDAPPMAQPQTPTEGIDDMFRRLAREFRQRSASHIPGNWDAYARAAEAGKFPDAPTDPRLMPWNGERLRALQAGKTIDLADIPDK